MPGTAGRSGGDHMPRKPLPTKQSAPRMPNGFSKVGKAKWKELMKLLPTDFLAPIDVYELKLLTTLLCRADTLNADIETGKASESMHRIYLNITKQIHQLSGAFGLNPADRARLNIVDKVDEYDPFKEWMFEMHGPEDPVENRIWRKKRDEENELQLKRRREERRAKSEQNDS